MCGAPDIRATQMSLTLTLSRQRARELEGRGNWEGAIEKKRESVFNRA